MARTRRSPPEADAKFAHRDFVMVSEATRRYFEKRWREIDQLWPPLNDDPGAWQAVAGLRAWSRQELRAEIRRLSLQGHDGNCLVPV